MQRPRLPGTALESNEALSANQSTARLVSDPNVRYVCTRSAERFDWRARCLGVHGTHKRIHAGDAAVGERECVHHIAHRMHLA